MTNGNQQNVFIGKSEEELAEMKAAVLEAIARASDEGVGISSLLDTLANIDEAQAAS